jgi:hypothetical protein
VHRHFYVDSSAASKCRATVVACALLLLCRTLSPSSRSWRELDNFTQGHKRDGDNQRVGCMLTDSLCARSELLAHCLKDPLLLIMISVSRLSHLCAFHFLPFLHHSLHRFSSLFLAALIDFFIFWRRPCPSSDRRRQWWQLRVYCTSTKPPVTCVLCRRSGCQKNDDVPLLRFRLRLFVCISAGINERIVFVKK